MINAYAQYQNNSIATASPGELTLMLYNGAIKFCNLTIEAMEKKDIQSSNTNCIKAQNIIAELQATLDDKYPISKEMDNLYSFINRILVEANIEKNSEKVKQALELIREFRDVWQEVMKASKRG